MEEGFYKVDDIALLEAAIDRYPRNLLKDNRPRRKRAMVFYLDTTLGSEPDSVIAYYAKEGPGQGVYYIRRGF